MVVDVVDGCVVDFVVMDEAAAEGFWDVHEFVDDDFELFLF